MKNIAIFIAIFEVIAIFNAIVEDVAIQIAIRWNLVNTFLDWRVFDWILCANTCLNLINKLHQF